MPFFRNKAQNGFVYATHVDGQAKTGDAANITARVSVDGAAVGQTNDVNPDEVSAADAPGMYSFNLIAAETDGEAIVLFALSSTANVVLRPVVLYTEPEILSGTAITDSTSNQIYIASGSAVNDFYKDAFVLFTSGTLLGQIRKILSYDGAGLCLTTDAFTAAPANLDTFVYINQ